MNPRIEYFSPSPDISSIVRRYISIVSENSGEVQYIPARPQSFFMFFIIDKPFKVVRNGEETVIENAILHGPVANPYSFYSESLSLYSLLIEFTETGLYRLLGQNVNTYIDSIIPLDMVISRNVVSRLSAKLKEIPEVTNRVILLDSFIREITRSGVYSIPPCVDNCLEILNAAENKLNVEDLSDQLGYSRQHICRNFKRYIGITPKEYIRILHFNRVFSNTNSSQSDILENEIGYFDQSHLIKEFKKLSGFTPGKGSSHYFEFIQSLFYTEES